MNAFDNTEFQENQWPVYIIKHLIEYNYDFQIERTGEGVGICYKNGEYKVVKPYEVTIRYTDLVISNDNGNSRPINELFVKFRMHENTIGHIQGARFKYREDDALHNYRHSHLTGDFNGNFTDFCLGNSQYISKFAVDYYIEPSEDTAKLFFIILNQFVRWESLEGGPYKKLEYVNPIGDKLDPDNVTLGGTYPPLRSTYVDFIIKGEEIVVSKKWIEDQLEPHCVICNGEYYSSNSAARSNHYFTRRINDAEDATISFYYKGQKQKIEVTRLTEEELSSYVIKETVHPKKIELYGNYIRKILEDWILEKTYIEKTLPDAYLKKGLDSNDAPMLTDIVDRVERDLVL